MPQPLAEPPETSPRANHPAMGRWRAWLTKLSGTAFVAGVALVLAVLGGPVSAETTASIVSLPMTSGMAVHAPVVPQTDLDALAEVAEESEESEAAEEDHGRDTAGGYAAALLTTSCTAVAWRAATARHAVAPVHDVFEPASLCMLPSGARAPPIG